MKTSGLYSLNYRDLLHGLIVAIGGAVIASVETVLQAGILTFSWHSIVGVALAAGLSYVGKKFFTPAAIVTPLTETT